MLFSSTTFIFLFLPIVLLAYFLAPKIGLKNIVLLIASFIFYAWGEPRVVVWIIFSIVANWLIGLFITTPRRGLKTTLLVASLVINIGSLFYFKYFNFFVDNINGLLSLFSDARINVARIVLPIGISFFTFQIMSYTIDVYRGQVAPQRNPFYVALYILLFPQLIAGPIVRYIDIEKEITVRKTTFTSFSEGVVRFMIGFCKKILISNNVAVIAEIAFGAEAPPFLLAWLGVISYALQIYFDFSGYSDMAIGLGKIFGFHFLENFNFPYIAGSIQDFWRRWHISLSTWFRDYLYIPLGGNRKGKFKTYRNLLIVFLVTGLWHGASWNFVVWGLFHGLFLMLEKGPWGRALKRIPAFFRHVYTLFVVLIGWVFFRAENLTHALAYLGAMFTRPLQGLLYSISFYTRELLFFSIAAVLLSMPLYPKAMAAAEDLRGRENRRWLGSGIRGLLLIGLAACYCVALLYMIGSDFNPFIYFRF